MIVEMLETEEISKVHKMCESCHLMIKLATCERCRDAFKHQIRLVCAICGTIRLKPGTSAICGKSGTNQ